MGEDSPSSQSAPRPAAGPESAPEVVDLLVPIPMPAIEEKPNAGGAGPLAWGLLGVAAGVLSGVLLAVAAIYG